MTLYRAWRWLACRLWWGHRFYVIAHVSQQSAHVGCLDCDREWGMNHYVRAILPWHTVAWFYRERGYKR